MNHCGPVDLSKWEEISLSEFEELNKNAVAKDKPYCLKIQEGRNYETCTAYFYRYFKLKDQDYKPKSLKDLEMKKFGGSIYAHYSEKELKDNAIKRWKFFNREFKLTGKFEFKGRCNELQDLYDLVDEDLKDE